MIRLIIILTIQLVALSVSAQDMIYDMSYGNRLVMNPAFAGNDGQGKFRGSMFHHSQFMNNRGPFYFSNASLDYSTCNSPLTFGLILQSEVQGDGFLRTTSISPIIGTTIPMQNATLSFGAQVNFINYSVDWSRFVFSDQLNPVYGINGPSSNTNASLINEFTTGFTMGGNYTQWTPGGAWNAGISINHLIAPRYSLLDFTTKLPVRYTFHFGILQKKGQYKINNAYEITGRYDHQDFFNSVAITGGWYANQFLFLGGGGRFSMFNESPLKNTLKPMAELRIMPSEKLRIQLSYGFNVSQNSSGLGNAIEIGLTYVPTVANCNPLNIISNIWSKNKKNSRSGRQKITCPAFQQAKIGTATF